jgi:hypothetical protein
MELPPFYSAILLTWLGPRLNGEMRKTRAVATISGNGSKFFPF